MAVEVASVALCGIRRLVFDLFGMLALRCLALSWKSRVLWRPEARLLNACSPDARRRFSTIMLWSPEASLRCIRSIMASSERKASRRSASVLPTLCRMASPYCSFDSGSFRHGDTRRDARRRFSSIVSHSIPRLIFAWFRIFCRRREDSRWDGGCVVSVVSHGVPRLFVWFGNLCRDCGWCGWDVVMSMSGCQRSVVWHPEAHFCYFGNPRSASLR
jgi:hypothetical protein